MDKKLFFKKQNQEQVNNLNQSAQEFFINSSDYSFDAVKKDFSQGWDIYSISFEEHVVALASVRKKNDAYQTKNSNVRIDYRGNGFSHEIKNFFEQDALEKGLKKIINISSEDNFRQRSLNESHGYILLEDKFKDDHGDYYLMWKKEL